MPWRRILVALAVLAVLGGAAAVVVQLWLRSDDPRHRLEDVLSKALHRDVTIAALELDAGAGAIELRGVTIANPAGWDGPALLQAERVRFDVDLEEALDGRLDGSVAAVGLDLRLVKRDGTTNVHGMIAKSDEAIDLDLDVDLRDVRVVLEDLDRDEELLLQGVGLSVLLSNRAEAKDVALALAIDAVSLRGVGLHHLEVQAQGTQDAIVLRRVAARVGEHGRLEGSGTVDLDATTHWAFDLDAEQIALDDDLLPIVVAFYPPAAGIGTAPEGTLDATLHLEGAGTTWPVIAPLLQGTASATLRDLVLPKESLAVGVAALAGRPTTPWPLGTTTVDVELGDGWVALQRIVSDGTAVSPPVTGRVGLDGTLDLTVDLMPLVRVYDQDVHATIARTTTTLPVRVRGTTEAPDFDPPTAGDVAKGLLGGLLHRALGE